MDTDNNTAANYEYDPYGKVISATGSMAEINPLRYRGYYYDQETGFYYLQSRYYDPTTCRFINADSYASTGQGIIGFNMFAYCLNNPAGNTDHTGHLSHNLNPICDLFDDIKEIGKDILDGIYDAWKYHAKRNDEQDDYLEELEEWCGDEKKMMEYIEKNWEEQPWYRNLFHMNCLSEQGYDAIFNVKYMSPDGRYEVIICHPGENNAYIVTSSVNKGTMNYGTESAWAHITYDMAPYFVLGNNGFGYRADYILDAFNVINSIIGQFRE